LQAVAPLILFIGSPWIPESPRWLILSDRLDEGREVIYNFRRTEDDPNNTLARLEYERIHSQIMLDKEMTPSWKTLFTDISVFSRLAIGFFVVFAAQSSGVLVRPIFMGYLPLFGQVLQY
jgi:hypothetical protein